MSQNGRIKKLFSGKRRAEFLTQVGAESDQPIFLILEYTIENASQLASL
jgi:hypothetical protein